MIKQKDQWTRLRLYVNEMINIHAVTYQHGMTIAGSSGRNKNSKITRFILIYFYFSCAVFKAKMFIFGT